ncbi:coxsackievirus and adenovirus receptor homolog [Micropterus salmoides]|uniref:coxsackievirus and adenovirus receptor homolog n=1 Tax=Micropterus salmoides TaxID=27706 RepID=UPI0018EC6AEE|nr:coxsackievirus and adenovirus receptor homolog [Micropterus salmoides]
MKDGDASVILKNVNIKDTGTYECWIGVKNSGRRKRDAPEPISTIKLRVTETQELKVKPGEDATLQCQSHRGADIEVMKWIRSDLKPDDGFVFYLSPDQINGDYQNSLFQGRVELQDPEMKNGDASVILKNVNINDAGTYECWVAVKYNTRHRKRDAPEPISTIELTVTETQEVKVKPGEDATLQCQSHRGADIEVMKWIRSDLKSDDFVFYLSPDQINGDYQNSLFQGRVELQDPEMKNGDASVILKNVNINDAGTYECWVAVKYNTRHRKRDAPEPISTIELTVTETQEVTVKPGENVTLQCQSHRGADIEVIAWSRTDLKTDGFVFFFRNDGVTRLSESYPGRVELRDPKMKDGDVSVILKNVNINDTGTYECWIKEGNNARRRKRDAEPKLFSTIKLTVTGHTAGNIWEGYVGVVCLLSLLLVAVGGFMVNQMIQRRHRPETTPDSESAEDALNPSSSSSV